MEEDDGGDGSNSPVRDAPERTAAGDLPEPIAEMSAGRSHGCV